MGVCLSLRDRPQPAGRRSRLRLAAALHNRWEGAVATGDVPTGAIRRRWTLGRRTYWAGFDAMRPSMWANRKNPHTVERRRSIVDAARPRSSIAARYSSMWGRVAVSTVSWRSAAHWKNARKSCR